jgi:hypothetical protein
LTRPGILIFTAVQIETRAIRQAIRQSRVIVHTAGIRAGHLPELAMLSGVSLIIMCGVAGALDPALRIGDVILDDPDHRIADSPLYRRGRIHTAGEIVASPAAKAHLFTQTGALAVDMEQAVVRRFAEPHSISVIGLRAISDTADQILEPGVIKLVDDLGCPRPIKIASALLRRPGLVRYLSRLSANTHLALKNLGPAVVSVVDHHAKPG